MRDMDHRAELRDFLRSHRARLNPESAGVVSSGGARRVPGLRREEVAHLAGVSPDYYTRLEQGRHPKVSDGVLDAVARALRLSPVERDHLYHLARPSAVSAPKEQAIQRVRPEVHQVLDALGDVSPAFVVNHRLDVLASNHLARALLTDFEALPARERNIARFVLFSPAARELYADWEAVAQIMVANLRLSSGRYPDDTRLNELIGEACVKVPEFNAWWASHTLDACGYGTQHLHHAVVGDLTLHHESLLFAKEPGQAICLYTAPPGSASAHNLALLASWTTLEAPPGTGHLNSLTPQTTTASRQDRATPHDQR
ncbi:helix-turn-helix transcriptional regulator [Streptomyces liangshanensis]|uniref:helix-turn-helix transcriptional regulator n=1 Tax=Streptomyces liangshanensis TaxID=2717324 RepID=UPI0036D75AE1